MSKKSTKSTKDSPATSYEVRDIVLGKVRGFPPWPGMVVDPDAVPPKVAEEKPAKKATFYCVQFFPTGDYAWLLSKDISKLQTHEIESYINEPFKRSNELLAGYRIALDPKKWEEEREALSHEAVEEEANAEVDQLESENEDGESKKRVKPKKRKRESDSTNIKTKKPPRAKKGSAEPQRKSASAKVRKNGTKPKSMVESEDDGDQAEGEDDDAGPSKNTSPPPIKKAKRDKDEDAEDSKLVGDPEAMKVREWRHKLQKTFLSSKNLPKEEDMPALDSLFTTVENYGKITIEYLQFSKIGKVMRHIAVLSDGKVPRDEEFKFRERARALVDKWHQILNSNKPNGSDSGAVANGASVKGDPVSKEETVIEGTAAIDLNGKSEGPTEQVAADQPGDTSILADVTMSEA